MIIIIIIFIFLLLRLLYILPIFHKKSKLKEKKVDTMVVLGSGGHTSEMLQLLQYLPQNIFTPIHYIISKTDNNSYRHLLLPQVFFFLNFILIE